MKMGRNRKPILQTEIGKLPYDAGQMSFVLGLSVSELLESYSLSVHRSISPTGKRGRPGFVYVATISTVDNSCQINCAGNDTVAYVWNLALQRMGV
jgi:hypothetical protein